MAMTTRSNVCFELIQCHNNELKRRLAADGRCPNMCTALYAASTRYDSLCVRDGRVHTGRKTCRCGETWTRTSDIIRTMIADAVPLPEIINSPPSPVRHTVTQCDMPCSVTTRVGGAAAQAYPTPDASRDRSAMCILKESGVTV